MDDVVAVVPDLFFQSRISSAARRLGRTVRYLRESDFAADVADFQLALVDLDAAGDAASLVSALRARSGAPIVAFGPHVDTERRKAAKAAGANRVLAKSKFVADLNRILDSGQASPK